MDNLEQKYTSTLTKMMRNVERLYLIKKHGIFKPISLQLAPTSKCNLDCWFCSVKNRNNETLHLKDIKNAVDEFHDLGIKTIELTGGGDPTQYDWINELIDYIHKKNIRIGFITNGYSLNEKLSDETLQKLTWLRVSMNTYDIKGDFQFHVPDNVTLGLSYVWGENADDNILEKIKQYQIYHKAKYVRVVPNCLDKNHMKYFKKNIAPQIDKYAGFFPQSKDYSKPETCWVGYLKPMLYCDGYIYHCSAIALIQRRFTKQFRMGHMSEIKKIWSNPKPFNTMNCDKCFFRIHSDIIDACKNECEHEDFL
jgi:organic radical activating enzyme